MDVIIYLLQFCMIENIKLDTEKEEQDETKIEEQD